MQETAQISYLKLFKNTSEEYWEDGSARCPRLPKCLRCEDHCYYSIMLLSHWFMEFIKHNQKEEVEDDDVFLNFLLFLVFPFWKHIKKTSVSPNIIPSVNHIT